jgi:hypothetical protein
MNTGATVHYVPLRAFSKRFNVGDKSFQRTKPNFLVKLNAETSAQALGWIDQFDDNPVYKTAVDPLNHILAIYCPTDGYDPPSIDELIRDGKVAK